MLHHSPTRSRLRAIGQAILPKLLRCIEKMYSSHYHYASDMPTESTPSPATSRAAIAELSRSIPKLPPY
jgi:hypothetical protein